MKDSQGFKLPITSLKLTEEVPLEGITSLRHVNVTTQLGVICKLAEGVLDPTVYVIDEDIEQYWSPYIHHVSLISIWTFSH
ncbi:testosterone 17-beta-dehydrogenase 3 [Limosa lapponica baueri]|uniref:Testosterone 17-beta-dehydrogenase 3 n=1 Tax=Limosa lapponica baueri TaxID=1758121 RepID=A0A2I0US58_LIMLA|nr:testosterone 17-beta-dehydrogenase 3 [Limosa lapponica baueri]